MYVQIIYSYPVVLTQNKMYTTVCKPETSQNFQEIWCHSTEWIYFFFPNLKESTFLLTGFHGHAEMFFLNSSLSSMWQETG